MSLNPRVGRLLYRSIVRSADKLTREFERCCTSGVLKAREMDEMRRHIAVSIPRDIRGLLDVYPFPTDLRNYIGIPARRLVDANVVATELEGIDGIAGFNTLKYLNSRVDILSQIGANTSSTNMPTSINTNTTNDDSTNIANNAADAIQHPVRITSNSHFMGFRKSKFQFKYNIAIENLSPERTINVLSRFWRVMDLNGNVSIVEGPGINRGHFPSILPGGTFEYESSCPLHTPIGTQTGHFLFHTSSGHSDGDIAQLLKVNVEPFSYRTPDDDSVYAGLDHLTPIPLSPAGNPGRKNGRRRRGGRSKKGGRTTRNKER